MSRRIQIRSPATAPYNNPPYALLDRAQSEAIGLQSQNDIWPSEFYKRVCSDILTSPCSELKVENWQELFFGTANESCEVRVESRSDAGTAIARINFRKGISVLCLCGLEGKNSWTTFTIESQNQLVAAKGTSGKIIAEVDSEKYINFRDSTKELKWDILCLASHSVIDAGEYYKVWWVAPPMCNQHEMSFPLYKSCRVCRSSRQCSC